LLRGSRSPGPDHRRCQRDGGGGHQPAAPRERNKQGHSSFSPRYLLAGFDQLGISLSGRRGAHGARSVTGDHACDRAAFFKSPPANFSDGQRGDK